MPDSEATSKGTILRSLLKFIEKELSPEQRARAIAALLDADRRVIEQPSILATQKIPEVTLNRLTAAAAAAKGESLDSFGRRAAPAELSAPVGAYPFLPTSLPPTPLLHNPPPLSP